MSITPENAHEHWMRERGAVVASHGAGLYQANPHEFGPGKVHIVDAENEERTVCGKWLKAVPGKRKSEGRATCKTCLNGVENRVYRKKREHEWRQRQAALEAERDAKNKKWWSWYSSYLESPEWRQRRRMVLERCGGVCEACRVAEATEVHHTSYAHVGREPLWELRGVCAPCHEAITEMDRRRRG